MEVRAADEAAGGAVAAASPPKERIPGALFRVDSLATLTAPVTTRTRVRSARLPRGFSPFLSSPGGLVGSSSLYGDGLREGEEKFPLPDNVDVWARYGFLDGRYLSASAAQAVASAADAAVESGAPAGGVGTTVSHHALVRIRTDPGDVWRRDSELQRSASGHVPRSAVAPSHGPVRIATPQEETAPSHSVGGGRRGGGAGVGTPNARPSIDPGSCTPSTVILTPTSQERCRPSDPANGNNRGVPSAAAAPSPAANAVPRRGDSLAASLAAAAAATTAAADASRQAAEEETKDQELLAFQLEEQRRGRDEAEADSLLYLTSRRGAASSGASSSSGARPGRRQPRSLAEIERHKRNRADRLRAYGCQRPLYARIVPGGSGGGSGSSGGSGCLATDEMETEQWVDTLRVSASLRGESLMAACSQSFADFRAAALLGDKQSEARASRTADISEMEGPDGLLHCAVLKGDHALAARAAQFLVDKRGASVNSRDQWGRTPLHTASGKGMVAMARFFIRRGANVDALDQDDRTPLFFACASGNVTMARYLTRIEVDARIDLADCLGNLPGHYFWNSVGPEGREEIAAVLASSRWPGSRPPRDRSTSRLRGRSRGNRNSSGDGAGGGGWGGGGRHRSRSVPPLGEERGRGGSWGGEDRSKRHSEGGEAGMKRLASDMMMLMKRR